MIADADADADASAPDRAVVAPAVDWDVAIVKRVGRPTRRDGARGVFDLHVRFRRRASRLVLFGPSGAGKTLTLMAIAGLVRPDDGHVAIDGEAVFDAAARRFVPPRARRFGTVFQDYALFPRLTVRQNVAFGRVRGYANPSRRFDDEPVRFWLETLELDRLADRYPDELSGGQRQRTALARALAAEPRALLLDEPFSALDVPLRARLRHELVRLQARVGIPMVVISHDVADIEAFGDAVVAIDGGRVVDGDASSPALATER